MTTPRDKFAAAARENLQLARSHPASSEAFGFRVCNTLETLIHLAALTEQPEPKMRETSLGLACRKLTEWDEKLTVAQSRIATLEAANETLLGEQARLRKELEATKDDAERYRELRGCIRGVHTEPGARGTGIYTWSLQICEPFPVNTQGDLMASEVDAAVDAYRAPAPTTTGAESEGKTAREMVREILKAADSKWSTYDWHCVMRWSACGQSGWRLTGYCFDGERQLETTHERADTLAELHAAIVGGSEP